MDSPLKWHGGKHYFAKKFIEIMPPHLNYVEPFAGSLAVLLEREPGRDWMANGNVKKLSSSERGSGEFVNDIHGELMNFWAALQCPEHFELLRRFLEAVPCGEPAFAKALGEMKAIDETYPIRHPGGIECVKRAACFFTLCRQSRAATFKDFTTIAKSRTRRGMNELPSAWLNAIEGLPAVHARLKGVVLLHDSALGVIRRLDHELTLFYLDPPYLHETRTSTGQYVHEMTTDDHEQLLAALAKIKGKFLLSGYRSKLYDDWAERNGFARKDFDAPNNAAGGAEKRRMVESVWMNF